MTPLFDLGTVARRADGDLAKAANTRAGTTKTPLKAPPMAGKPVDYWVRGVFRHGGKEATHTIRAVGMSDRLDADVAKFITHLTAEGWQFPEGRASLMEVLGVGADDGIEITLSRGQG